MGFIAGVCLVAVSAGMVVYERGTTLWSCAAGNWWCIAGTGSAVSRDLSEYLAIVDRREPISCSNGERAASTDGCVDSLAKCVCRESVDGTASGAGCSSSRAGKRCHHLCVEC